MRANQDHENDGEPEGEVITALSDAEQLTQFAEATTHQQSNEFAG